jgi:hypothetical protein
MGPKGVRDTKTDRPTDRRSKHQPTNCFWIMIIISQEQGGPYSSVDALRQTQV